MPRLIPQQKPQTTMEDEPSQPMIRTQGIARPTTAAVFMLVAVILCSFNMAHFQGYGQTFGVVQPRNGQERDLQQEDVTSSVSPSENQKITELLKRVAELEKDQNKTRLELEKAAPPITAVTAQLEYANKKATGSSPVPSCRDLMRRKDSPFKDGSFLTRRTMPVTWYPRADDSRELRHPICDLHRYTAQEAQQCLTGKHLFFAGDSLTRYQFLSLATFLHTGTYPPRFGRGRDKKCVHVDETGNKACSPDDEPNICMEGDWSGTPKDPWQRYYQAVGSERFDGYLESTSIRRNGFDTSVDNFLYASPVTATSPKEKQFLLSFTSESGWADTPTPIRGFNFTGCAYNGSCNYTDELFEERWQRLKNESYDFNEPFVDAISPTGMFRKNLPPVDIAQYNRGLWGALNNPEKVEKIAQNLYDFTGKEKGRCFFRSTTGRFSKTMGVERGHVKDLTLKSGCGYIDSAHLLEDFNEMEFRWPPPPSSSIGVNVHDERLTVYWDAVHFMPWVYEELNTVLLNILCNVQFDGEMASQ